MTCETIIINIWLSEKISIQIDCIYLYLCKKKIKTKAETETLNKELGKRQPHQYEHF